eukprot:c9394_g1_i1.p1 GENE.c9394_g1_i1~~c9394_g1_i1.p1  ORF type:complete len:206 (+),score=33.46 c9394_g1_i1:1-618(+)
MLKRGAFVLLEGVDRCGKTTQCRLLAEKLQTNGIPSVSLRFPDRETTIGHLISDYLQQKSEMQNEVVHLLFSANRWEKAQEIQSILSSGTTVVMDRYSYSGVAYSAAKGMSAEWCLAPERGLPKPDLVFFLHISSEVAQGRGQFGQERYETEELQKRVREQFDHLMDDSWKLVDANRTIEDLHQALLAPTIETVQAVQDKPIQFI